MVFGNGSGPAKQSSLAQFGAILALGPSDDRSNAPCGIGRIVQRARRWLSLARNAKAITISLCIATCLPSGGYALAGQVRVVASNNAYADIARQIGGAAVIISIANNPRDAASEIRSGSIMLCGWTGVDAALCDAARRAAPDATLIELPRHRADETIVISLPWYDTASTDALTQAYADRLMRMRPGLALQFAGNLARMRVGLAAISHRVGEIAKDYADSEVIAADPLSRAVAKQLGFKTTVLPVTNDPSGTISPKSAHNLEKAIEDRDGSIFLYDRDLGNLEIKKLVALAIRNAIPTVGLQDQLPTGLHYQQWVLRQWNTIHGALNEASP
jgi:ABC-type Zn uptake system ZnuABC Zn-binding protein ZnuA